MSRWDDQDPDGYGPEPSDYMHPVAWHERVVQQQQRRHAEQEAASHTDWLPRTVAQMVAALDPPETEQPQHHHEIPWSPEPEQIYDDRGWPPGIGVFYD